MTNPLYKTARWKRRSLHQRTIEPLCRYCLAKGIVNGGSRDNPLVADHIKPHRGDEHEFYHGELQTLCMQCHNTTKQREENNKRPQIGADGWPMETS